IANILRLWVGQSGVRRQEAGFPERHSASAQSSRQPTGVRLRPEAQPEGRQEDSKLPILDSRLKQPGNPQSPITNHPSPITLSSSPPPSTQTEQVAVLETQIDDLNPQAIGFVLERLLDVGALDVFTQAIAMKKSRPGTLLTVICHPENAATCEAVIFRETTTLGIRSTLQQRQALPREIQFVQTDYGTVRVKVAWAEGRDRPPTNVQPEYEDCAQLARQHHLPWRNIHQAALQSWYQGIGKRGMGSEG
ncbi:MAG: LarC family nickel insertion protein, partial [Oscillatoriales cyanobacterium C42_A2020_001]|nr:LarC family nickel insertion protein [Leptolyngbyaceae cyanobacterium C42_A2020_001]